MSGTQNLAQGTVHDAFFYESVDEYLGAVVRFVRGADQREPALVAVSRPKAQLLSALLESDTQEVVFADMADLGRNPARIIAALRRFVHAHPGTASRFLGEPVWPGRSAAEYGEVVLHEALLDTAVEGRPVSILCPYNVGLGPTVLDDAGRTHSHVITGGQRRESPMFDPTIAWTIFKQPLPPVPRKSRSLVYHHGGLAALRRFVEQGAVRVGFPPARLDDLLLAVSEVATNTLAHVGTPGRIHLWHQEDTSELICDFCDEGHITELLAGRFGPYPVAPQGWGLWMVNQVCDLVEIRSGEWGSNVRLHMQMV